MRSTPFDRSFADFDDLLARMNQQFDEMNRMWERRGDAAGVSLDVADHDGEIVVTADLPGFDRD
ncbi:MAG: Hsp20/alpha crystallin family protein, partial [Salinigranum sp.]